MTPSTLKWGILSTAKIGRTKVIPGIQKSALCEVVAISSRKQQQAEATASDLGIPKAYASYEALLADPNIDAVYNPLPNHLHVPWTLKALAAGKHVLCEKPIALDAQEAQQLLEASEQYPELKVMEAFMYRFHPQWIKTKEMVEAGALGEVKSVQSFFSYFNADPNNIRNQADIGGGGLMDIGCYCISFARFLFEAEPQRVVSLLDHDPVMKTDRIASGLMNFSAARSAQFTCSTQLMPYQRCLVVGTEGSIEIEIPVNAPPDKETRLWYRNRAGKQEEITFAVCDQYTLQAEAFAEAVLQDRPVPTPLSDAVGNMQVIDAVIESAQKDAWVTLHK